jgi:hypothetical protein
MSIQGNTMELILAAVLILFAMTWLVIDRTKDDKPG